MMDAKETLGTSVFLPLESYFRRIGLRNSIVLCQLPLTVAIVLIVALTALFSPANLQNQRFLLVLLAHGLIFLLCFVMPWSRLQPGSFAIIPMLDCLALGVNREIGGPAISVVGLLMALPVAWLAVSTTKIRVMLAIAAALASTIIPPVILGETPRSSDFVRMVVFPTIMAVVAITAYLLAGANVRQREAMERKDCELQRLYELSQNRQRLLDGVVQTVSVGVWVVDADGNDILTNELARAARIRAAQSETQTESQPEDSGDDQWTQNPLERAARGEEFSEELFWVGTREARKAYSTTARALRSDNGNPLGSVVAFTDVTALIQAMTVKDKFVASMSHELRTPLTSILGYRPDDR